jgi:general secretion pathway protein G
MKSKGLTLIEIMIVVIILGILAEIVIPQFLESSNDARASALQSDLQTVRTQLEIYKTQHLERYPHEIEAVGAKPTLWIAQLTSRTDRDGNVMPSDGKPASYPFGPYLKKFPTNEFITDATAGGNVTFGTAAPPPCDGKTGWYVNTTTGKFSANDAGSSSTSTSIKDSATSTDLTPSQNRRVTPIE